MCNKYLSELKHQLQEYAEEEVRLLQKIEEAKSKGNGNIPEKLTQELNALLALKQEKIDTLKTKSTAGKNLSIQKHVDKWKDEEGNLILILHSIQNEFGYVPRDVAMELALALDVKLARIYEVITFYYYFKLIPPGKHNIALCNGTACYLKGTPALITHLEKTLGIKDGETTKDKMFHFETVRCIGCCGMAPAMTIDGKTFGKVKLEEIESILNQYRNKEVVYEKNNA